MNPAQKKRLSVPPVAAVVALLISLLITSVALAVVFSNGDFETGDFTGWTKDATMLNGGITVTVPPAYLPVPVASVSGALVVDKTFIVNTAWMNTNFGAGVTCDPNTLGHVCLPFAGSNSAVVNYLNYYASTSANMNTLKQSGLMSSGDVGPDGNYHIFFAYAPVLNSGGHTAHDQPFMYVRLTRTRVGVPDKVLFDRFSYPSDGNPNWVINGQIYYMPWQVYDLTYAPADLNAGDSLAIEVTAAGCIYTAGGHWGYVYVDQFGAVAPAGVSVPSISSVTPNSGPTAGGTTVTISGTHFISATAVTIGGNTLLAGSFTVVDDNHITLVTPAHPAGLTDITIINSNGSGSFPNSFTYVPSVALTVAKAGTGTGVVSSAPAGISCGITCTAAFVPNSVVTLTAAAAADSVFVSWAGASDNLTNPVTLTLDTNRVVTATFNHAADLSVTLSTNMWSIRSLTMTITARNYGPAVGNGAVVSDTFPLAYGSPWNWTCVSMGGAVCPAASGSGDLNTAIPTFPVGGVVTYTVSGALQVFSHWVNTVHIYPPTGVTDQVLSNNLANVGRYMILVPIAPNNAALTP